MRFLTLLLMFSSLAARAAHPISGAVRGPHGEPVAGAMVTLTDPSRFHAETVYSDATGKFRLWTDQSGKLELRVRHPLFKDFLAAGVQSGPKRLVSVEVQLMPFATVEELSDSLPASAHAAAIQWKSAALKSEFVSQCNFCHQFGNALTRRPRSLDVWHLTIARMEGMGAMLSWRARSEFPGTFVANLTGKPLNAKRDPVFDPALTNARIEEWGMGEPISFLHDLEAAASGKLYVADMNADRILELDPATSKQREWKFPDSGLPLGGMFSAAINPFGTFQARHAPHSIIEGPDHKLWTTNSFAGALMSFDPATARFQSYPIPAPAVYPHTLRLDRKGRIWFTLAVSNQVGRFDPATGKYDLVNLPTHGWATWLTARFSRRMLQFAGRFPRTNLHMLLSPHNLTGTGHEVVPLPYGLDVSPLDGSVWYTKLNANRIGRIDPESLAVEEFETPRKGPRRGRFDPGTGMFWIPSFMEGALMSFDTQKREFKSYVIPPPGPGELETPYALNVHPVTHEVWITGGASDRMYRFEPKTEKFTTYPLPTRVTFLREVVFTPDGTLCSSYSNLPAHAIEGGRPKVVCLRPGP